MSPRATIFSCDPISRTRSSVNISCVDVGILTVNKSQSCLIPSSQLEPPFLSSHLSYPMKTHFSSLTSIKTAYSQDEALLHTHIHEQINTNNPNLTSPHITNSIYEMRTRKLNPPPPKTPPSPETDRSISPEAVLTERYVYPTALYNFTCRRFSSKV